MNSSAAIVFARYKCLKYKSRYLKTDYFDMEKMKDLLLKKLDPFVDPFERLSFSDDRRDVASAAWSELFSA